jgi:hypothetical protein
VSEKYIGFFRLLEACEGPGCPVCAYLEEATRRQVHTLFDEHVTDVTTRQRLRASWGLCNWHAWLAIDTRATASGVAILCEDLLRVCHARLASHHDPRPAKRPGLVTRVRSWLQAIAERAPLGRAPARLFSRAVAEYRERPRCTLCAQLSDTEAQCLDSVLHFAEDPQFGAAYQRSAGLCVPHLVAAMERGSGAGLETIVSRTLAKWQALRSDLAHFVSKHEYRSSSPITEAESRSYHLALELLAGRRNVFGNDMRRG